MHGIVDITDNCCCLVKLGIRIVRRASARLTRHAYLGRWSKREIDNQQGETSVPRWLGDARILGGSIFVLRAIDCPEVRGQRTRTIIAARSSCVGCRSLDEQWSVGTRTIISTHSAGGSIKLGSKIARELVSAYSLGVSGQVRNLATNAGLEQINFDGHIVQFGSR